MSFPPLDTRNLSCGREIPTEHYSDQPYLLPTDDGAWLCVMTTGPGHEGQSGQHVVSFRSTDQGQSWAAAVDVEPSDGPEASYAVLLKAPGGRVYCFYNHNTDNTREVIADDPPFKGGLCSRVDSQGYFVFKYSDDHGRSWSAQRYPIPQRLMDIDRRNPYQGALLYFWNVGKAFWHEGAAYVSLHKVGRLGDGFFVRSEGVLLRSGDLLTVADPAQATWETLPEGDYGLRTPPGGGLVAEEQSYSVLSDGSFYCVYRTVDGHPGEAYSRDGGRTWGTPRYKAYADGRLMRHPRAANFTWRCQNGKYLHWYHNHGGRDYEDRNPVWLSGGVEADSPAGRIILWSQPEIVLYDDDPMIRISYPDLLEEGGQYYLSETQKDVARIHELDPALLKGLWGQFDSTATVSREGLVLEVTAAAGGLPAAAALPSLPPLIARDYTRADYGTAHLRTGFSLEVWLQLADLGPQTVLDSRLPTGQGLALLVNDRACLEIVLNDGRTENRWDCDAGCLQVGREHHVVVTVDGGPHIITFVVDGRLHDGGEQRQFGWGRFSPHLRGFAGADTMRLGPNLRGELQLVRLYGRALRTSEACAHYRAGRG